jgi:hypothetical protein
VKFPFQARLAALALAVVLVVTFAWRAFDFVMHRFIEPAPTHAAAGAPAINGGPAPWQREVVESIDAAAGQVAAGNSTEGEMGVDRAASLIEAATVSSQAANADFFELASAGLDGILRHDPQNNRLLEHVTLARIELAQLRSELAGRAGAPSANTAEAPTADNPRGVTTPVADASGPGVSHVVIGEPRSVGGDRIFGPAQAGGDWLDARNLSEFAEILLPPSSRLLVDNVRVQNLTIEGGAQTLDGFHWKNVTFIGTRIRYEGGEVDLRNVHFLRCRFGFSTDEPGSRLANAIALGQSSIVIN